MIKFRRNKETGILEVWKDGKLVGSIITMGDEVKNDGKQRKLQDNDG